MVRCTLLTHVEGLRGKKKPNEIQPKNINKEGTVIHMHFSIFVEKK